jgi:cytochrome c-type biogenesis protein CcmH
MRRETRRRSGRRRLRWVAIAVFAVLLTVAIVPGSASAYAISDVSSKIICQCGCGSVLDQCPHQDCGWGVPAKEFISQQLGKGKTPEDLLQYYVSQFGQKILAAPTKTGFNITAWVTPFALLIAGGLAIYYLVRLWVQEGKERETYAAASPPEGIREEIVRRFEDELKHFD